ncbi:MAG: leucyl aminopeptidase [Nitrospirae bacterium]|nr:leucyl aminopeptidase [Nitrospirota bacterium]
MNIYVKKISEKDCACDVLVLPFTEGDRGPLKHLGPSIKAIIENTSPFEFQGKKNEVLLLQTAGDLRPKRLLLVGLGKKKEIVPETIRQAGGKALSFVRDIGFSKPALSTITLSDLKVSPAVFMEGGILALYRYDLYKSEKDTKEIKEMTILSTPSKSLSGELTEIKTLTRAVGLARDLVNTPANAMTPSHLAHTALALRKKGLSVSVLESADAEKLGMGAYLSVSRGSDEPPKFIVLEYKGGRKAPIVLIGKSVTFDSGGINIKPSDGLEKMKYDMAGGAAVLAVIKAVSELRLPVNLVGILPATENLPGGGATRPGDVVKAINGTTIEIINTDAEGRMTLADAIGYAKKFTPSAIIDIATLTGACAVAFGGDAVAMMGNDRRIMETMKQSGEFTNEKVWEMPLFDEYREYLKSDIADIKNIGGRTGSLVTSAKFLSEFAGETPWVHLDIAGTAWTEKDRPYTPKGASGIGVRLLFDVIRKIQ